MRENRVFERTQRQSYLIALTCSWMGITGLALMISIRLVFSLGIARADSNTAPQGGSNDDIDLHEKEMLRHDVKNLGLSDDAEKDLSELARLRPHMGSRVLHGRLVENPSGAGLIIAPDTASVRQELTKFSLDDEAIWLFAVLAAAQGNVLQWEKEANHTSVIYGEDGKVKMPPQQQIEDRKAKYKKLLADDAKVGANALRKLGQTLGEKKISQIMEWLNQESVEREMHQITDVEGKRQQAKAACIEGLKTCSFPEGVVANCAGYLGMSVKELKEKCPIIKNSNAK